MRPRWFAVMLALALVPGGAAGQGRQGLVTLPDARVFYEVVGEGDPVVIVHGGPGLDHRYLRPGLDVLSAGRALVYFDQRGVGRSTATLDSASIHLDGMLGDIDALREALGHETITVLGHSFGSLIALGYALAYPERTRALILMNPVEPGSRWRSETAARSAAARSEEDAAALAELAASPGYQARDPATLSQIFRVAFRGTFRDPANVDALDLTLSPATARNGQHVARLLGRALQELDWWDRLPGLAVPTLILAGRFDPTPAPMLEAMADALPMAELVTLDTGHFPYVEDPGAMAGAVARFLSGVGR